MSPDTVNILLAEDNKANQFISKAMIETLGVRVEIAEDGLQALELVQSGRFALVLMDCQMPRMDGLEATRRIRALPDAALAGIPIVALTADAQRQTRDECKAVGMNDFLTKPFTFEDLKRVVDAWVRSRSA